MFISTNEVCKRTGLSKPTIWRYRKRFPDFPKPVEIKGSSVLRWVRDDIDQWMLSNRKGASNSSLSANCHSNL